MAARPRAPTIEGHFFTDDSRVRNNPRLLLIVYRGALETGAEAATPCSLAVRAQWLDRRLDEPHLSRSSLPQQCARGTRHRRGSGPRRTRGRGGPDRRTRHRGCCCDPARCRSQERRRKPGPPRRRRLPARTESRHAQALPGGSRGGGAAGRCHPAARRRPG